VVKRTRDSHDEPSYVAVMNTFIVAGGGGAAAAHAKNAIDDKDLQERLDIERCPHCGKDFTRMERQQRRAQVSRHLKAFEKNGFCRAEAGAGHPYSDQRPPAAGGSRVEGGWGCG
jgi:hypothetical protein